MVPRGERGRMNERDTTRWYGSLIAIVSGVYAIGMATWGAGMGTGDWFSLILGVVVLAHGVALVGRLSSGLDAASGVLMIVYAVLMVLAQGWAVTMGGRGMSGGAMGGQMMGTMGWSTMAWDPGMTAIAIVMLGSGLIMTVTGDDSM